MRTSPRPSGYTPASKDERGACELSLEANEALVGDVALTEEPADDGTDNFKVKWAILSAVCLVWFAGGLTMYLGAGFSLIEALYGMSQILSTVGYGDIVPTTQRGKIFVAVLVLTSTIIASGCVTAFLDHILDQQSLLLKSHLARAEQRIRAGPVEDQPAEAPDKPPERQSELQKKYRLALVNLFVFLFFILAGTLFFGIFEACSCGVGLAAVEGCRPDDCEATGGHQKTFTDAFYMSAVTLTTVGFGDVTAVSLEGRLFCIFWILFGVGSMINFVSDMTELIHSQHNDRKNKRISGELFRTMDEDGNGLLDRVEFLKLQMVMQGLAAPEDITMILRQFDMIDRSCDGTISMEEVKAYYT